MASIRVDRVRQVFNDGNHNAFTDLCRYNGALYLTFRSCPDGHMLFTSSQILVLKSNDGGHWQEICRFNVADRDVRDPHFLVFEGKLFVASGTWWVDRADSSERDINDHLGYCVWSEDGQHWYGPRAGWHPRLLHLAGAHKGMAYLNGRRFKDFAVIEDRTTRDDRIRR